jgi:hypothetical protein
MQSNKTVSAYRAAFLKHYPNAKLEITQAVTKRTEPEAFWVAIDGDKGNRPLTYSDMQSAIADFSK